MKALLLEAVERMVLREVPDPTPDADGAVVRVHANGVCRTDWHFWVGDKPGNYPLLMGHEFCGVVEAVGKGVTRFKAGDRVVVPFSGSDGTCEYCRSGRSNLCDAFLLPGAAYKGGYAEYVGVPKAERNLVHLPETISFRDGAALGCRFMTAFHGLMGTARVRAGEWVVIYGCGGVGLSAINIAAAAGAYAIGVDINQPSLELAQAMGAAHIINSRETDPVAAVQELTRGGAHVSVDALGIAATCLNGVRSLRKGGRHVQIGLTTKEEKGHVALPVDEMIAKEIQFLGSFGMPVHRYDVLLSLVASGRLAPARMVSGEIALSEVESVFRRMSAFGNVGTYVVTRFE